LSLSYAEISDSNVEDSIRPGDLKNKKRALPQLHNEALLAFSQHLARQQDETVLAASHT
jgi:hypothetical protein